MKFSKALTRVVAASLLLPCVAFAAPPVDKPGNPNPGRPQLGEPVTPHGVNVDLRNMPAAPAWVPGQAIREAHKRQYHPLDKIMPHAPASMPVLEDQLPELQQIWDESAPVRARNRASGGRVNINNGNTGVSPGDPVVAVGSNHVLYGVNGSSSNGGTTFTVYDKSGSKLAGPISMSSLAPAGHACRTSWSDPIIMFDRIANRWFMLEMGGGSSNPHLCTYVSKSDDPVSGGWWFYGFSTPSTPDYPHCGVWNNAYVCGTNEGGSGAKVYAFDRERMLTGGTARAAQRFTSIPKLGGYGFQIVTPVTFFGTTAPPAGAPMILARHNDDEAHAGSNADGTKDFIDLFALSVDWDTPANSSIATLPKIDVTEFNSWFRDYSTFATVPQPNSNSRLDPIREVILNQLVYRNFGTHEAIVGNYATNRDPARSGTVVHAGIRWFELRKSGTSGWSLHQEGTYGPGDSNTHHLMGGVAMDKNGNIGLGYNVTKTSSPVIYPSLRYTGRKASDPLGVMTLAETDIAIGSAAETSGRWGDYHQMTVDPVDDCTFWYVGMYRPSGGWQTRITDFKFDDCGGGGTPTTFSVSGTVTNSSGVGIGGVSVGAGSVSAVTGSNGSYTLTNLANGNYTITPTLSGYSFSPTSRSVAVDGANVSGQNFTGTADSGGGNELQKGVAATGLAASQGNWLHYTMNVPAGASNLSFTISGGTGDADLYVKHGSQPTTSSYDCRPYQDGNNETCSFASPQAGTWYVSLRAYSTFSGVSLIGDYSEGGGSDPQTYTNNTRYDIPDNNNTGVSSPITVSGRSGNAPSNTPVAVDIVHTYKGDLIVDLIAPDGSVYNLHNRTGGSADNINTTYTVNLSSEPLNGTWLLRARDRASQDIGYINSWSITF